MTNLAIAMNGLCKSYGDRVVLRPRPTSPMPLSRPNASSGCSIG